jgi:hypothetical protein
MSMLEARHFIGTNCALPEPICPRQRTAHFIRTRAVRRTGVSPAAFGWWANSHELGGAKLAAPTIAVVSSLSTTTTDYNRMKNSI